MRIDVILICVLFLIQYIENCLLHL